MAQDWAKAFYNSKAWGAVRDAVLKRDRYCCVRCHCPASTVHHIIRLSKFNVGDPMVALNPRNLETLCDECHKAEHKEERVRAFTMTKEHAAIVEQVKLDYEFDAEGNIVPPGGDKARR